MLMIEDIKMMQTPYLDIWSMLLSGQMLHRNNSSYLFWNLKYPLLLQTLSLYHRIKITYQLYRLAVFIN